METAELMEKPSSIESFLLKHKLFFVESKIDDTVLVGLLARFNEHNKTLTWWDTNKERIKTVSEISTVEEDKQLSFIDEDGKDYTFVPMDLQIYKDKVMEKVGGYPADNLEEVIENFEKTII